MQSRMKRTCIAVVLCAVPLAGCAYRFREPPYMPALRDGHIKDLVKLGNDGVETGYVVVLTQAVLAHQPFQPEELRPEKLPSAAISMNDLPICTMAEGRLASANFPANHVLREGDLMPQGIDGGWHPIHRAKKSISAGELFTEDNTICRFVQISARDATPDVLMRIATRPIQKGHVIHLADIGPDLWEYVYYARHPIASGEALDPVRIERRLVKARDQDGEWNYADCSDTTQVVHAAKEIKCGAPIRCSDLK